MKRMIVGLCFLAVAASARPPEVAGQKAARETKVRYAITILKSPQEWLYIYSDGSGLVGFGAGGGNGQGRFEAGTFDVAAVTKQLKGLPPDDKGAVQTHYSYAFESERRGPEKPGPAHFTRDKKVIDSLFKKAAKASGWGWQGRPR